MNYFLRDVKQTPTVRSFEDPPPPHVLGLRPIFGTLEQSVRLGTQEPSPMTHCTVCDRNRPIDHPSQKLAPQRFFSLNREVLWQISCAMNKFADTRADSLRQ